MKSNNDTSHDFENSDGRDDYGHCLVCRKRGFSVSGEWFHYTQHLGATTPEATN